MAVKFTAVPPQTEVASAAMLTEALVIGMTKKSTVSEWAGLLLAQARLEVIVRLTWSALSGV